MDYPIPSREEVEEWIESEEGQHVYRCLGAIDRARHGNRRHLLRLYHNEEVSKKPTEEQLEWLKEQMPIEEIYHAAYIPEMDSFIFFR